MTWRTWRHALAMQRKTKRPMRSTEEQWRSIILEQKQSGLSAEDFCKSGNYSFEGFQSFQKKLRLDDEGHSNVVTGSHFAQAKIIDSQERVVLPAARDFVLELVLPSGITFRFCNGCPQDVLSNVLAIVESINV